MCERVQEAGVTSLGKVFVTIVCLSSFCDTDLLKRSANMFECAVYPIFPSHLSTASSDSDC